MTIRATLGGDGRHVPVCKVCCLCWRQKNHSYGSSPWWHTNPKQTESKLWMNFSCSYRRHSKFHHSQNSMKVKTWNRSRQLLQIQDLVRQILTVLLYRLNIYRRLNWMMDPMMTMISLFMNAHFLAAFLHSCIPPSASGRCPWVITYPNSRNHTCLRAVWAEWGPVLICRVDNNLFW